MVNNKLLGGLEPWNFMTPYIGNVIIPTNIFQRGRYTTNQIIHYFCGFVYSMVKLPWVKQCHKPSPSHHHKLIGGINLPFPVMGGKNGIVLPTYPWFCYWDTRINRINPLKNVGVKKKTLVHGSESWVYGSV